MKDIVERIKRMEECFDDVQEYLYILLPLLEKFDEYQEKIKVLMEYQESGKWMDDFTEDEEGNLPADLKRGVLSEDSLYDLVMQYQDLLEKFKEYQS